MDLVQPRAARLLAAGDLRRGLGLGLGLGVVDAVLDVGHQTEREQPAGDQRQHHPAHRIGLGHDRSLYARPRRARSGRRARGLQAGRNQRRRSQRRISKTS
jgi:hypothetical protein